MSIKFKKLNKTIVNCKKCKRLRNFSKKIAIEKRKQNVNESYWGKPVTGFGHENSKLLIVGLAPAAHGGNRTGRAFTGDKSGDFLFRCLYNEGIANQSISQKIDDGLKVKSTFITNILKCVPPQDKPNFKEIKNCSIYFKNEIKYLKKLRIILTLGKTAFDNFLKIYYEQFEIKKKFLFKHGENYLLPDGKILISCYHPSPRNVNTGLLNEKKMRKILKFIKKKL
jgi:uracil-DNA glycosylase family 4